MWFVTYNVKHPPEIYKVQRRLSRNNKEDVKSIVEKRLVQGFEEPKDIKKIKNVGKLGVL